MVDKDLISDDDIFRFSFLWSIEIKSNAGFYVCLFRLICNYVAILPLME